MILNKPTDLKQVGFDSSNLGFDDIEKDGIDETSLDRYLNGVIYSANKRLSNWVGEVKNLPNFKVAELNLAIVQILPLAWSRNSVGYESLKIEGMDIAISNPDESNKKKIIQSLVDSAELNVIEYIEKFSSNKILSHD